MTRKTKKKTKKKRRTNNAAQKYLKALLPYLPYLAPIIVTAFIYMWIYTSVNIDSMPIAQLKQQKEELIKHNDSIKFRIEELQAPEQIDKVAREELGMISPEGYRTIALDEPMRPPGIALVEHRPPDKSLQANKGSEGLFGFLDIGFLKQSGKHKGASHAEASEHGARQSG